MTAPVFVPDTNVCLDLFVFDDPRCASLHDAVERGEVVLVTRDDCRDEWLSVLDYPALKLDDAKRAVARERFDRCTHVVQAQRSDAVSLPRCRDADDQKFLELAWQARAAALLTRDDELLRLARRAQREHGFAILPPVAWAQAFARD